MGPPCTKERSSPPPYPTDGLAANFHRVIIAVLGQTGTGKTTFINTASGSNLAVDDDLESCTAEVQESNEFELDGRLVTLIDTPGFDDAETSDVDVLEKIAGFLARKYKERVTLAGVIYIHRITDIRMTGTSKRNFTMLRQLCGENALQNLMIVTVMWDKVGMEEGERRERKLRDKDDFFKTALERGAQMARHERKGDSHSTNEIIRRIIWNYPVPLRIQQELVDEGRTLAETSAGKEVNRELMRKIEKHENEMGKGGIHLLGKELAAYLESKNEEISKLKTEQEKLKNIERLWFLGGVAVGAAGAVAAAALLAPPTTAASVVAVVSAVLGL